MSAWKGAKMSDWSGGAKPDDGQGEPGSGCRVSWVDKCLRYDGVALVCPSCGWPELDEVATCWRCHLAGGEWFAGCDGPGRWVQRASGYEFVAVPRESWPQADQWDLYPWDG